MLLLLGAKQVLFRFNDCGACNAFQHYARAIPRRVDQSRVLHARPERERCICCCQKSQKPGTKTLAPELAIMICPGWPHYVFGPPLDPMHPISHGASLVCALHVVLILSCITRACWQWRWGKWKHVGERVQRFTFDLLGRVLQLRMKQLDIKRDIVCHSQA